MNIYPNRGVRDPFHNGIRLNFLFSGRAGDFPGQRYLYVSAELANTSGIVILDCPPVTSTEPSFSRVAV
jgi:hypothetical protein